MGFTLQSFPPPQVRTPFGAVALLLFLTSRSSALRTSSEGIRTGSDFCVVVADDSVASHVVRCAPAFCKCFE